MAKKHNSETALFHPGVLTRIKAPLIEALGEAKVLANFILPTETRDQLRKLDALLPTHGPQYDRLDALIGPNALSQVIAGRIEESFRPVQYEEGTRLLTSYSDYADTTRAAERLLDYISGLPDKYIFSLKLSGVLDDATTTDTKLTFSKDIGIYGGGPVLDGWLPLETSNEKLNRDIFGLRGLAIKKKPTWSGSFLLQKVEGYTSEHGENELDQRVTETIKSFYGLYMAHNLVSRRYNPLPASERARVIVHRFNGVGYDLYRTIQIDDASNSLIQELHFDDLKGKFSSPDDKRALITELGEQVSKAFSGGYEAERIRLAGRWLFDSYAGGNQLMSFLQAMVVLEILLGDKASSEKIGLGELLRNRCAYLLGKSAEERSQIMTSFNEIYDVRSAIVHRGKSMLRSTERPLFFKLRTFAQRVIRAELQMLSASPFYPPRAGTLGDGSESDIETAMRKIDLLQ